MKTEVKHPDLMNSKLALSSGVIANGCLYVSGQGPLDLTTGKLVPGTIEEETRLTLRHIEKILHAGGCTFDNVVKCTCHLADIGDFPRFNATYSEFFKGVRPARTTVQSVLMLGIKVEIDCIACIPQK